MDRILSYQEVENYLSELADKNVDLRDFCGASREELDNKVASVAGFGSPGLVFFGYRWKLSGNKQRTHNTRTISFAILISGVPPDDYAAQTIAISEAEAIGLEVLSRIYQDSHRQDVGWLYDNFDKESVIGEDIPSMGQDGLCGMEFSFDLKVSEPLVVTHDKWSDGNLFC